MESSFFLFLSSLLFYRASQHRQRSHERSRCTGNHPRRQRRRRRGRRGARAARDGRVSHDDRTSLHRSAGDGGRGDRDCGVRGGRDRGGRDGGAGDGGGVCGAAAERGQRDGAALTGGGVGRRDGQRGRVGRWVVATVDVAAAAACGEAAVD